MNSVLQQATGLPARDRKVVTYWTLATHALPFVDTFPLLALTGKLGTGKSQALRAIRPFAYRAHVFALRSMTLPVIRDELAKCNDGTAIIEEADAAWNDKDQLFERMLSDRYQRQSAESGLKKPHGEKNWESETKHFFGATVLHRRLQFHDAALEGRSVAVHFRPDHSRHYADVDAFCAEISDDLGTIRDLTFRPVQPEPLVGVAARIFKSYKLVLATATMCEDHNFRDEVRQRMLLATVELKEAQSVEPDGLVLRAILEKLDGGTEFRNIKVSDVAELIFRNHRISLMPRQVAGLARQLGLETKNSHGATVVVPQPIALLKACQQCGYEDDEAVSELHRIVLGDSGNG